VRAAIATAQTEQGAKHAVTVERVLEELARLSHSTNSGSVRPGPEVSEGLRAREGFTPA
jgi:hypothetical protein